MNNLYQARWEKGKKVTLGFYKVKLPWKSRQLNRKLFLPDYFDPMIRGKKEVKIADLGAGMFCLIGSNWKTAKVEVYPSDALADEFNQILKEAGITPILPVVRENMENLTYPDNFFDIVHCRNALDHSTDPLKAIKEMYRVVKPGGFIYLRHFINVGQNERYFGLHLWNINIFDNNDCVIWNPDKKFLLSDIFRGFKTTIEKESDYKKEEMVVSILHK